MKTKSFFLLFFAYIQGTFGADERLLKRYNRRLESELVNGEFRLDEEKNLLYSKNTAPDWAVQQRLEHLGITHGYGTGGVSLFRMYGHEEWKETSLYRYAVEVRGLEDKWGEQEKVLGAALVADVSRYLGADLFKHLLENDAQKAERKEFLNFIYSGVIPAAIETVLHLKTIGFTVLMVLILIALPIFISNLTKALFAWIFTRRPKILGAQDSDIYANFFARIFWRFPKIPKIIVNPPLQKKLKELTKNNKKITLLNRGTLWKRPKKTPYPHILGYGNWGVGKTLFAKNLAKESGMHFLYLTVSDLSQLNEEEALETLKNYFRYARRFAPCIFIIDEVDRVFDEGDIKAKKIALLLQREFSKAVDDSIQLVLLTNHPQKIPSAILNRLSKLIHFCDPTHETQKKLFVEHLRIAFSKKSKPPSSLKKYVIGLDEATIQGLVGRNIEAICASFVLSAGTTPSALITHIQKFKRERAEMEAFCELRQPKKIEPKPPSILMKNPPPKKRTIWS